MTCRVSYEGAVAKRVESSTELLRKWLFSGAAAGVDATEATMAHNGCSPALLSAQPNALHAYASPYRCLQSGMRSGSARLVGTTQWRPPAQRTAMSRHGCWWRHNWPRRRRRWEHQ